VGCNSFDNFEELLGLILRPCGGEKVQVLDMTKRAKHTARGRVQAGVAGCSCVGYLAAYAAGDNCLMGHWGGSIIDVSP